MREHEAVSMARDLNSICKSKSHSQLKLQKQKLQSAKATNEAKATVRYVPLV